MTNREGPPRQARLTVPLTQEGDVVLTAERLRDGRMALGTRRRVREGEWASGDLLVLDRSAFLALAGWLGEAVEEGWIDAVRERQAEPLRTAVDLYGEAADGAERLALEMVRQIPAWLLRRAMLLLVNSLGPAARETLVDRLNRTPDISEDGLLRRRLAEEEEALAYAVAAAALFDAIDRGLAGPGAEDSARSP